MSNTILKYLHQRRGNPHNLTKINILLFIFISSFMVACQPTNSGFPSQKKTTNNRQMKIVVPKNQAYSGAYIEFGHHEDNVTLEGIERFDKLVGKKQAIIAFSSDWGNQSFPDQQLNIISSYGAIPLIFWSPWDRPTEGWNSKPGRFDLNAIIAGQWDGYIDYWATQAKAYGNPLFVSWGLEMNGYWFPWSGIFYGAGKPSQNCKNCFEGPETFKKAYRYVIDRVRAKGASNILWVWHANNASDPDEPWNAMAQYYPGPQYVDWLGITAYGVQFKSEGNWVTVDKAIGTYYQQLCQLDEEKPLMLAEWGVGEFPEQGSKAHWIADFLERASKDYPRIRAAVFWHERWQNDDGSISNLRVNSSSEALKAYRQGIANPFWLARPLWTHADHPE
ncbi:MAG TPA: glycosyl hydrolase [Candidatus Competibacteraceae bacterium]|nr:glycosyl hydrolase [Candidatus Competibacteraceae bacterium]